MSQNDIDTDLIESDENAVAPCGAAAESETVPCGGAVEGSEDVDADGEEVPSDENADDLDDDAPVAPQGDDEGGCAGGCGGA